MNLHDIKILHDAAMIWGYGYGGNGRRIGPEGLVHVYRVERGVPPPLGSEPRRYWHPYNDGMRTLDPRVPICGRLRTQSRHPQFQTAWRDQWHQQQCPDCLRLVADARWWNDVSATDPFTMARNNLRFERMGWQERMTQIAALIDPVTGM
jgi:hypothetical protein